MKKKVKKHERVIAYNPYHKIMTKSTPSGLLLSQLIYWFKIGQKKRGKSLPKDTIMKANSDLQKELLFTEREMRTALKGIQNMVFLEAYRAGNKGRMHYKIDWERYQKELKNVSMITECVKIGTKEDKTEKGLKPKEQTKKGNPVMTVSSQQKENPVMTVPSYLTIKDYKRNKQRKDLTSGQTSFVGCGSANCFTPEIIKIKDWKPKLFKKIGNLTVEKKENKIKDNKANCFIDLNKIKTKDKKNPKSEPLKRKIKTWKEIEDLEPCYSSNRYRYLGSSYVSRLLNEKIGEINVFKNAGDLDGMKASFPSMFEAALELESQVNREVLRERKMILSEAEADISVRNILEYSKSKMGRTDTTRSRAKKHIRKLLLSRKYSEYDLLMALDRHYHEVSRNDPELKYCLGLGNFFGRDAEFKEMLSPEWRAFDASEQLKGLIFRDSIIKHPDGFSECTRVSSFLSQHFSYRYGLTVAEYISEVA